jgi:hypothetical protein
MREFYELCSKAENCARKDDPTAALAVLIEAYALIRPEVVRARSRLEPWTAQGLLETLRMAAVRCGGGFDFDRTWGHPTSTSPTKTYRTDGNTSSLKRYRWNEWRERPEHWFDVACRCPSF